MIKVEPLEGDPYRLMPQFPNLPKAEHNYAWELASRNKRGLALDLKSPAGREVLNTLVARADVFITNYPLPVRARLGIGYEAMAALNPKLVYASLSGYGEEGAEAERPGFDAHAYWARSGLADVVRPDPDGPPATLSLGMGDQPSAAMLYGAIVTALYQRERTGQGAWVQSSLIGNGAWANAPAIQAVLCGGEVPYRLPRHAARNALTCFYRCREGRWFMITLLNEDKQWPLFTQVLDAPALAADERFATQAARRANAPALVQVLDAVFGQRDSAEWQQRFQSAGLTASVVARTADALDDAQMRAAGVLVPAAAVPHTGLTVDSPFRIAGQEKVVPRPAPAIGEHTDAVLREHGFAPERIAELRAQKIVG